MPITVLRGLPGVGKSTRLIETVNAAIEQGRPALTFACSDSPWLRTLKHIQVDRVLVCRRPGLTCPLHHFVSAAECAKILSDTAPGTLVAFEEAYWFGIEIAPHWLDASRRGFEVLIVWPSKSQLKLLKGHGYTETTLVMKCQRCAAADASSFVYLPNRETILSICAYCRQELTEVARREIRELLGRQATYLGENTIYEPIPLEEYAEWKVLRLDALGRGNLITHICREIRLLGGESARQPTYLDVGCGTGYLCHFLRRRGFYYVEGVDMADDNIAIAKLLDSFFLRDHNIYQVADYYQYLRDTQERLFDVTSALSIFRWPMPRRSVDEKIACLEWLFAKTKYVCFLEPGYSPELHHQGQIEADVDRSLILQVMEESGSFSKVLVFKAETNDLMSDLFVGLKAPVAQLTGEALKRLEGHSQYSELYPRLRKIVCAALPRDATVIVVSKGDDELLDLGGRRAWHFPQTEEGWYIGYHPGDSAEAIGHLEALHAMGGDFLVVPSTALWWFEYYTDFRQYLERHYQVVVRQEDTCVIFALRDPATDLTLIR